MNETTQTIDSLCSYPCFVALDNCCQLFSLGCQAVRAALCFWHTVWFFQTFGLRLCTLLPLSVLTFLDKYGTECGGFGSFLLFLGVLSGWNADQSVVLLQKVMAERKNPPEVELRHVRVCSDQDPPIGPAAKQLGSHHRSWRKLWLISDVWASYCRCDLVCVQN